MPGHKRSNKLLVGTLLLLGYVSVSSTFATHGESEKNAVENLEEGNHADYTSDNGQSLFDVDALRNDEENGTFRWLKKRETRQPTPRQWKILVSQLRRSKRSDSDDSDDDDDDGGDDSSATDETTDATTPTTTTDSGSWDATTVMATTTTEAPPFGDAMMDSIDNIGTTVSLTDAPNAVPEDKNISLVSSSHTNHTTKSELSTNDDIKTDKSLHYSITSKRKPQLGKSKKGRPNRVSQPKTRAKGRRVSRKSKPTAAPFLRKMNSFIQDLI